jgi:DNA helicase-2/ATP-dependent DNA helicase PcrA
LEFPHAFLAGWNEGTLPSRKTKTQKGMEEERRLAFVAMTRAEHSLYISSASGSDFKGEIRYPSRFILDIEADRLSFVKPLREELVKDLRDYAQKTLTANEKGKSESSSHFDAGTKISHPILGIGEIISVDEENSAYEIKFDKLPTNRVVSFRVALTKI